MKKKYKITTRVMNMAGQVFLLLSFRSNFPSDI